MASMKLLVVFVLQLVLVLAFPAENDQVDVVNRVDNSKLSTTPALLVDLGAPGAGAAAPGAGAAAPGADLGAPGEGAAAPGATRAGCTDDLCWRVCQALGWRGGYCISSTDCLCYS